MCILFVRRIRNISNGRDEEGGGWRSSYSWRGKGWDLIERWGHGMTTMARCIKQSILSRSMEDACYKNSARYQLRQTPWTFIQEATNLYADRILLFRFLLDWFRILRWPTLRAIK